jgi:hypothetical protein
MEASQQQASHSQQNGKDVFAVRSFASLYAAMDAKLHREKSLHLHKTKLRNAIETCFLNSSSFHSTRHSSTTTTKAPSKGFKRIELCCAALNALDRRGWERSYHQRYFHNQFIRACARVFWKTETEGQFAKDHQKILELNGSVFVSYSKQKRHICE